MGQKKNFSRKGAKEGAKKAAKEDAKPFRFSFASFSAPLRFA
jgi:hypothetical protein